VTIKPQSEKDTNQNLLSCAEINDLFMEIQMFAPGCALMLYKPELALKLHSLLNENLGRMNMLLTCCQHDPGLKQATSARAATNVSALTIQILQRSHYGRYWQILISSRFPTIKIKE
jgi:hypothetical protein